ncbi:MAG: RICIN domain-containing protein [Coriobacteriales bacterium]|nr:RICIN domain-containing protein [Coriobacteriales bacterium]
MHDYLVGLGLTPPSYGISVQLAVGWYKQSVSGVSQTGISLSYLDFAYGIVKRDIDKGLPIMVTTMPVGNEYGDTSYNSHTMFIGGYRALADGSYELYIHDGWYPTSDYGSHKLIWVKLNLPLGTYSFSFNSGWHTGGDGYKRYFNSDGTYKTGYQVIGGVTYRFDDQGRLQNTPAFGERAVGSIDLALDRSKSVGPFPVALPLQISPAIVSGKNPREAQRFVFADAGGGMCWISNYEGDYLSVSGGKAVNGAPIIISDFRNDADTKWFIERNSNGSYTFASALNPNFCIDVKESKTTLQTPLILWAKGADQKNQQFYVDQPIDVLNSMRSATITPLHVGSSGSRIDINGGSTADGAQALLYQPLPGQNQRFNFTYDWKSGYYKITAVHSSKVLDAYGGGTTLGSPIIQFTYHGRSNQWWSVEPDGQGNYIIRSAKTGYSFDVEGSGTTNGTRILMWTYSGTPNQKWRIKQ